MKGTGVLEDNLNAYEEGYRVIANKGGTRSSKTYSVLQLLLHIALEHQNTLISVVSESFPHLKRGALRDFEKIVDSTHMKPNTHYRISLTDHTYTFPNASRIEFFSVDNAAKVHGAQRDVLFINECNHISYETYRQLAIRTAGTIFIDWNPTSAFWYDDHLHGKDGVKMIHSTYINNPFLDARQVAEIKSNEGDSNWWRVYGLGENGSLEGLIFTDWDIVDDMPKNFKREFVGIDFGFVHDETAVTRCVVSGGELYTDEICYRKGLDNTEIARILKDNGFNRYTQIVCDSSEPKSIAEINSFGFNCVGVNKTKDSINVGIQILQRYKIHVTRRSVGAIRELRNYSWRQDKDGNWLNVPIDMYNHYCDSFRYIALTWLRAQKPRGATTAHSIDLERYGY